MAKVSNTCDECGERAEIRLTFLLPNARTNPASSGYGGDDISYCSDGDMAVCEKCFSSKSISHFERIMGMEWCGAFGRDRFPHMFEEDDLSVH